MDFWPYLLISLVVLAVVISPLLFAREAELSASSASTDLEQLGRDAKHLVERFHHEKRLYGDGQMSRRTWRKRQIYLENCYVDVARRIDILKGMKGW